MPRRSSPEYRLLFQTAIKRGSLTVPLENLQEAKNLRSYLYHYRGELRRTGDSLFPQASQIKFKAEPYGLRLEFKGAPGTEAIRQALGDQK